MSNVTLSMLLTARDDASGVFRRVGAAADGVDRSHTRMARTAALAKTAITALGVAAAGAAVYFAKDSVRAYADAEKAQLALQDAYARYPKLAGANINAIRALNTQMQAKTRFDDDDLALMESRLAAYQLTGSQLMKLTPLVADYAAKTGKDVVSAGTAVGKALLGNTRALKEIGINYTSTGNRARDFANIVRLLNARVGGFAKGADAKTAEATLRRLDNAFEEVQETVGAALLPYVKDFANWLTSNMPAIQRSVAAAMPKVRQAFTSVADAAKTVGTVLKSVYDGFQALPGWAKTATAAIAGLGFALKGLKATGILTGGKLIVDIGAKALGKGMCCPGGGVPGKPGAGKPGAGLPGWLGLGGATLGGVGGTMAAVSVSAAVAALWYKFLDDSWNVSTVDGTKKWIAHMRTTKAVRTGTDRTLGMIGVGKPGTRTVDPAADASSGRERMETQSYRRRSDAVRTATGATAQLTEAQTKYRQTLADTYYATKNATGGITGNSRAAQDNRSKLMQVAKAAGDVRTAMTGAGKSQRDIATATRGSRSSFMRLAEQMGASRGEAGRLAAKLGLVPSATQRMTRASQAYGQIARNVAANIRSTTAGITGHTKAATANRSALRSQGQAAHRVLSSMKATGASSVQVANRQRQLAGDFMRTARQMGASRKDAAALAKQYGLVPKKVDTKVAAPGAKGSRKDIDAHTGAAKKVPGKADTKVSAPGAKNAKADLDDASGAARVLDALSPFVSVSTSAGAATDAIYGAGAAARAVDGMVSTITIVTEHINRTVKQAFAGGGRLRGPGTDTSDNLLLAASPDEYVVKAVSARAIGYHRLDYINATGRIPSFAAGGKVGGKYTPDEQKEIDDAVAAALKAYDRRRRREARRTRRQGRERYDDDDTDRQRRQKDKRYEARQERIAARQERREAAAEARRTARDKITERRDKARQAYEERRAAVAERMSRITGFASVTGFDLSAAANAQEEARLARAAVGSAGSPNERARALQDAKAAQVKAAQAAVTPANVKAWMTKKLNTARAFVGKLKKLQDAKLNATTLSEVAGMDPDTGLQMAEALLKSNIAEINQIQAGIINAGAAYGDFANARDNAASSRANAVLDQILQGGTVQTAVEVHANLHLDGKQVYEAVLREQRRRGQRAGV